MNILVTGAEGQLGRSFQKISQNHSEHNFLYTDLPETDITNKKALNTLVKKHTIDVIINCAAYTAVDKAEREKELAYHINAYGPKILSELAKENNLKLVHISTDYVFDGTTTVPIKESYPTNPKGVYGKSKLEGEFAITSAACDAVIIRTAWLYSEFGNNFVKTMLRLGKEKDTLSVVYDQVGTPTYATDLALAVMQIIDNGFNGYHLYHYSNEGVLSWYDFAYEIFALSGMKVHINPIESNQYPTPAKRPAYSVLSKEKIKNIGIKVPYWKESLTHCLSILNQ
jgi:dTDP-4-dehydrorhamnose reductase